MNRDEKRSRAAAVPPSIVDVNSARAIFPREPNGGTWIAANDGGVCVALINWYRINREPGRDVMSRGQVVRELAGKSTTAEIAEAVMNLPLHRLRPFRLIAVVPLEQRVTEWRWNLEQLIARKHDWQMQHWFSSGFNEERAERERERVCTAARDRRSLAGLRQLHRSHRPKRGPFSICMHRDEAATVSYTEVAVSRRRATMRYKPGPCCSNRSPITRAISLARSL